MSIQYPVTRTSLQTDNYHGTEVPDPYRWLEAVESPETRAWVAEQNAVTFGFLDQIPARTRLNQRLTELWNYAKMQPPRRKGGQYFFLHNSGLQNQDALYVTDTLAVPPRLLLDPNALSADGTVAITEWEPSPDGRWLAYAVSASGSDWQIWRLRNVETGTDLPDEVRWSKFGGATWLPDSTGFFYSRYPAPEAGTEYQDVNHGQCLYLHRRETLQSADELIYERPDHPEWGFHADDTADDRYLILSVWHGTDARNRLFYRELTGGPMHELLNQQDAFYGYIGNEGDVFYILTDWQAPRRQVIAIDLHHPESTHWRTIIPEGSYVLDSVALIHDQFVAVTSQDAHHSLHRFDREGHALGPIPLPGLGTVTTYGLYAVSGLRTDTECFFGFTSFLSPLTIYRYDFVREMTEPVFSPTVEFDVSRYETRQVFVPSRDGTRVPLYLTHRKGLLLDGQNPVLLYGYGGFSLALMPDFAAHRLAWLEMGGVFAQANLRGGTEYGETWHQGGMLANKQNVFDDFIACAEWLIAERITCPARLAIHGRSNGGLLVGACLTQRPDLFGACLPAVGVMDMLRFNQFTIGWAWVSDYGSPDDPGQFKTLYAYSPLHNLKPGTAYPATLITTADHDDRVVPGHSFKFAAALQAAQSGPAPVLIRIQSAAGHGFGKPTAVLITEWADQYAFLVWALGLDNSA